MKQREVEGTDICPKNWGREQREANLELTGGPHFSSTSYCNFLQWSPLNFTLSHATYSFPHKLQESLFYCSYLEAGCLLKMLYFPGQDPSTLNVHMIFWVTPPWDLQTLARYFSLKNYLLCLTEVSSWQVAIFYGSTKKKPLLLKNKFLKDEGQLQHENIIYNFILKAWKYTWSFFAP